MESSRVKYVEIVPINSQSTVTLVPIGKKSINKYTARGLQITAIHMTINSTIKNLLMRSDQRLF